MLPLFYNTLVICHITQQKRIEITVGIVGSNLMAPLLLRYTAISVVGNTDLTEDLTVAVRIASGTKVTLASGFAGSNIPSLPS